MFFGRPVAPPRPRVVIKNHEIRQDCVCGAVCEIDTDSYPLAMRALDGFFAQHQDCKQDTWKPIEGEPIGD